MKRVLIIDDEEDAREGLRTILKTFCPEVEVCGMADGVESGFMLIRQTRPDCILLDISMSDGTGFDLLDKFPHPFFHIIFTTAHDEFALKAFRYHAMDYLLKPINPTQLVQAIGRIKEQLPDDYAFQINNLLESARTKKLNKITLTNQNGIVFLQVDQIVHLESDASYTTFYLLNKERHVSSRPLKYFEDILPGEFFFKLHQSHLINLSLVKGTLREDGDFALMEDGCKVPIARRKKDEFLEVLRQRFTM